jgi:hypothetical protein
MAINPDRIIAAHSKLAEDPHDVDSWLLLIKHAQCRLVLQSSDGLGIIIIFLRSVDEARETYEQLVQTFPTCGRYWKTYIEQEVISSNPNFQF